MVNIFFLMFLFHFLLLCWGGFMMDFGGIYLDWEFLSLGGFNLSFSFLFDWVSLMFSSFVFLISSLVFFYGSYYMSGDLFGRRFNSLLLLFVSSMILLVFGSNVFTLMIGWDGLGLVSFCLVIYYSDKSALMSGLLTVYSNRLGDVFIVYFIYFSVKLGSMNFEMDLLGDSFFNSMFVLLAALTKSAQFPFSAWLPAAMAAPTPISSLVHSSTLVTAGAYLIIRFNFLLAWFSLGIALSLVSSLTMVMAGLNAIYEIDMSKVIAMSTLSQLGLMFFLLSFGEWVFSFYHLLVHALFKSLMFLSCGGFIFSSMGDQDARMKGGMIYGIPFFSFYFLLSSFGLMGFPFLAGFYSKDMALDLMFGSGWFFMLYFLFFFGCVFTLIYSLKVLFFYLSEVRMVGVSSFSSSFSSSLGLIVLGVWTVIVGLIVGWFLMDSCFVFFSFPFSAVGIYLFFSLFIFYWFGKSFFEYYLSLMYGLAFFSTYFSSSSSFLYWNHMFSDYSWLEKSGSAMAQSLVKKVGSSVYSFDLLYYLIWVVLFMFWGVLSLTYFFGRSFTFL